MKIGQVYRFGDRLAIWLGTGETRYIAADEAKNLAEAIGYVLMDMNQRPKFSQSTVGSFIFQTLDVHEKESEQATPWLKNHGKTESR